MRPRYRINCIIGIVCWCHTRFKFDVYFIRTILGRYQFQVIGRIDKLDDANEFGRWQYIPNEAGLIPQQPTPVHMNLWLLGKAPSDGAEVEIIISQFAFTPLDQLG
jgi:hypothetical protein